MNVFTYAEPIFPGYQELLKVWQQSWAKYGWTPIVIGESQFRLHPESDSFDRQIKKLPTTNDARYDAACFRRWMAMATIGGLMTDADVMNLGFRPDDLFVGHKLMILAEHHIPCVVYGDKDQYGQACHQFSQYKVRPTDKWHGKPLVEDMTILHQLYPADWFDVFPVCSQYGTHTGKTLVHCSTESLGKKRLEVMRSFL